MYLVEFFADKVLGLDTIWDTLHTFVRIPGWGQAGDMLAAGCGGIAAASRAKWLVPKEGATVLPGPTDVWVLEAKFPGPDLGQSPVRPDRAMHD